MNDYDEALRLIRQHMQPGDTVGQMFMRAARALEECRTPFASTLTADEAAERLRQINRLVHDTLVGDKRRSGSVDSAPLAQSVEPPLSVGDVQKSAPPILTSRPSGERLPSSDAAVYGADTCIMCGWPTPDGCDHCQSHLSDIRMPVLKGELR